MQNYFSIILDKTSDYGKIKKVVCSETIFELLNFALFAPIAILQIIMKIFLKRYYLLLGGVKLTYYIFKMSFNILLYFKYEIKGADFPCKC